MKHDLPVAPHVVDLISELQNAGYEAYIVGGAIRDLLLGRKPKDFDISTSATPEEVRAVFGRRIARIIGKRFRLVHVEYSGELFEVSTFRRAPTRTAANSKKELPENLILSDNSFGTAEEDAWRRDFTVNALFYDPVNSELLDYTGQGIDDIRNRPGDRRPEAAVRGGPRPHAAGAEADRPVRLHDGCGDRERALFRT